jgi:hypothetical protein
MSDHSASIAPDRSALSAPRLPGPAHRALEVFVGTWQTEGVITAGPSGPVSRLQAVDTYEWLPGGFFLLHRVDGHMGDEPVQALEVIGYDASRERYVTWSFDHQGATGTYQALLRDGAWTIYGESERFSGAFSDDRLTLTGTWEQSSDGATWVPWMTITLRKVT